MSAKLERRLAASGILNPRHEGVSVREREVIVGVRAEVDDVLQFTLQQSGARVRTKDRPLGPNGNGYLSGSGHILRQGGVDLWPRGNQRLLRGDLDNMVMMALRKEPERRYASVEQLAEDVGRYLDGRPVMAQKDTVGYRVRKFVRRHRIGVGMASAFVLLLIGFSVVTALQARTVARERDSAQAERDAAQVERDKAEQVVQVLVDLFETSNPTLPGSCGVCSFF